MTAGTVLITGATGHLGFRVLVLALDAGYNARVAVRDQAGIVKVLNAPSIKERKSGNNVSFVTVPDILASGAYDEAVQGVQYVIHCASPITSGITEDFENKIIIPAVNGTTGLLESARHSSSVKRVVITSSIVATIPAPAFMGEVEEVFDGQKKIPLHNGTYGSEFQAYMDSKVRALAATYDFIDNNKPSFDLINIMPSFIIGKNELTSLPTFLKGTNRVVFGQVLGADSPGPLPGATVYLNDVAKVHVLALDPKIAGNQDFPVSSGGIEGVRLEDAKDVVARKFPAEVKAGIPPNSATQPTLKIRIDSSKTEQIFGFKLANLETQVEDVARHYVSLWKEDQEETRN